MIDVNAYMQKLISLLQKSFGKRLEYVGLQGSYRRGEANENSDIDAFVIIKNFSLADACEYRQIITSLNNCDKSCGFICSSETIKNWNKLEICQLLHETENLYGTLSELLPQYDENDIRTYIKLNAGNILHEITHRYIHSPLENSKEKLRYTYKSVFYILQNKYYLQSGEYVLNKNDLLSKLSNTDREVLQTAIIIHENNGSYDFDKAFSLLFKWCNEIINNI